MTLRVGCSINTDDQADQSISSEKGEALQQQTETTEGLVAAPQGWKNKPYARDARYYQHISGAKISANMMHELLVLF